MRSKHDILPILVGLAACLGAPAALRAGVAEITIENGSRATWTLVVPKEYVKQSATIPAIRVQDTGRPAPSWAMRADGSALMTLKDAHNYKVTLDGGSKSLEFINFTLSIEDSNGTAKWMRIKASFAARLLSTYGTIEAFRFSSSIGFITASPAGITYRLVPAIRRMILSSGTFPSR